MSDKLSFSIEGANVIEENPNSSFATIELDFFASGKNLHDMYVSEETLLRTANTIKNCPLVWKYDEAMDDIYTHDKDETPCGFIPSDSPIQAKLLEDGRTMLSVIAYVWKRYTGKIVDIFRRDGGKKPVSVEMSVFDTKPLANGLLELLDFRYEGVTILGTFVTPAIPMAKASVLSFSEMENQYEEDLIKEFPDFYLRTGKIPNSVKENAKNGILLSRKYSKFGPPVGFSAAKFLSDSSFISEEKAKEFKSYFDRHPDFNKFDENSEEYIFGMMRGGVEGQEWLSKFLDYMSKKKDIANNVSLSQKSVKSKTEKMEKSDMDELEKQEETSTEMAVEEKEAVEMEAPKEEEKEEEEKEAPEKEEKEEFGAEMPKFEFPTAMTPEAFESLFAEEEEGEEEDEEEKEVIKNAKEEFCKGKEFADPAVVMGGMFAKMRKMSKAFAKLKEQTVAYMAENEELKKFKASVEESQKQFAVEKTLRELAEKVILPDEVREEMVEKSKEFAFADLASWETYCKARSFDFALREKGEDVITPIGMPFTSDVKKQKNDLWS